MEPYFFRGRIVWIHCPTGHTCILVWAQESVGPQSLNFFRRIPPKKTEDLKQHPDPRFRKNRDGERLDHAQASCLWFAFRNTSPPCHRCGRTTEEFAVPGESPAARVHFGCRIWSSRVDTNRPCSSGFGVKRVEFTHGCVKHGCPDSPDSWRCSTQRIASRPRNNQNQYPQSIF